MIAPVLLVKDIKLSCSDMVKSEKIFPNFREWQDRYGVFTYLIKSKGSLIEYMKRQKEHHREISFREEYIKLLLEHGVEHNEKYLF